MMERNRWTRSAGVLLLALAPTACQDLMGSGGSEDGLDYDVAVMAAELALEDVGEVVSFGGASPSLLPMDGASDAVGESVTHSFSRTFYDELGAEMDSFDPLLTASVRTLRSWSRERTRGQWSGSFQRESDRTLSGLLGEETERTLNGTGSGTIERSRFTDSRGLREYDMSWTSTIDDVVFSVDRETNPYPLSGTITRAVVVTRVFADGREVTRTRNTVVTFDGTQFATITVDGEEFEIDLAATEDDPDPPVRRR